MGMIDAIKSFLTLEPMQERQIDSFVDHPGLTEQLMAVQGLTPRPWRVAGVREALGVPAILRAVTLISNTTGALSLEAYRKDGTKLDNNSRPRIIVRPNPFTTPRDFYRDTAWSMASRGEAWWWVAKRDTDGTALSLLPVNPAEVAVTENERDLRYPIIEWRGRRMPNEDMRQITLAKEPGTLRGVGPLQLCGAAVSVAVEAQEWAANFFASGGYPSVVLKSEVDLTEAESAALKAQWANTPPNMPRVTTPNYSIEEFGANPQGAQMLQARDFQVGDVARMFGIPSSMLDYSPPGSSLTYQNLEMEFDKFVRACLWPNYLEAIEQAISDLLTRSTVARFNIDALLRADIKTRYEVYASGVGSGVLTPEEARTMEGLAPGDVENAPVPFAQPQAVPGRLPIQERTAQFRCDGKTLKKRMGTASLETCNRLLAESETFVGTCPRCKKNYAPPESEELRLQRRMVEAMERPQEPTHVTVNVPPTVNHFHPAEQPPPVVNVAPSSANVDVSVSPTPIEVRNEVSVEPTPVEVRNEVTVEPTPVEVRNNVRPTPVTVNLPKQRTTKTIVRDQSNQIVKIVEESTDG